MSKTAEFGKKNTRNFRILEVRQWQQKISRRKIIDSKRNTKKTLMMFLGKNWISKLILRDKNI
jgi:hypothetical protein